MQHRSYAHLRISAFGHIDVASNRAIGRTFGPHSQAQLVAGQIQVAGSLTFALADFEIVAPNVGGFIVSIADQGALEFLLVFAKS